MTRVLGLALLAAAALSGSAAAQQNWLIGDWLFTQMDPRGISNTAVSARFEPNGRMTLQFAASGTAGSGYQTFFATWRMTGPQSYVYQIVDYEPRQVCGVVCVPVQSILPMGMVDNCNFEPINQVAMAVSCRGQPPVRFTRQN